MLRNGPILSDMEVVLLLGKLLRNDRGENNHHHRMHSSQGDQESKRNDIVVIPTPTIYP